MIVNNLKTLFHTNNSSQFSGKVTDLPNSIQKQVASKKYLKKTKNRDLRKDKNFKKLINRAKKYLKLNHEEFNLWTKKFSTTDIRR